MAGETQRRVSIILAAKDEYSAKIAAATGATKQLALMTERYADVTDVLASRARTWGQAQVAAANATGTRQEALHRVMLRAKNDVITLNQEQKELEGGIASVSKALDKEGAGLGGVGADMKAARADADNLVSAQKMLVARSEELTIKRGALGKETKEYNTLQRRRLELMDDEAATAERISNGEKNLTSTLVEQRAEIATLGKDLSKRQVSLEGTRKGVEKARKEFDIFSDAIKQATADARNNISKISTGPVVREVEALAAATEVSTRSIVSGSRKKQSAVKKEKSEVDKLAKAHDSLQAEVRETASMKSSGGGRIATADELVEIDARAKALNARGKQLREEARLRKLSEEGMRAKATENRVTPSGLTEREEMIKGWVDAAKKAGRAAEWLDDKVVQVKNSISSIDDQPGLDKIAGDATEAYTQVNRLNTIQLDGLTRQADALGDSLNSLSQTQLGTLDDTLGRLSKSITEAIQLPRKLEAGLKAVGEVEGYLETQTQSATKAIQIEWMWVRRLTDALGTLITKKGETAAAEKLIRSTAPAGSVVRVEDAKSNASGNVSVDPRAISAQSEAIKKLTDNLNKLNGGLVKTGQDANTAEAGLGEVGGRVKRMVDRMDKLREANAKLRDKNNALTESYRESIASLGQYRTDLKKATDNEALLIKATGKHATELKVLTDKNTDLSNASSRLMGKLEAVQEAYKDSDIQISSLKSQIGGLNQAVGQAETEQNRLQSALNNSSQSMERMRTSYTMMVDEVRRARSSMKESRDAAEQLRGRYDGLKTKVTELAASKRALSKALESAEKKAARMTGVAKSLQDSFTDLHAKLRDVTSTNDVYTGSLDKAAKEAREMARDVAGLMKAQSAKAKETKESTNTHISYAKSINRASAATRTGTKNNESYALSQGHMRGATTGLRHMLGQLRNTLLLVTFAFGSLFYTIGQSIRAANEMESSLLGLSSVAKSTGQSILLTNDAALTLSNSGLLSVKESSEGLRNLLAAGFGMKEATDLMNTLTDAAAFNRQGTLALGQAVVGATQGIKNQNSIMVDNAGITKNLSIMYKDYATQIGSSASALSEAQKNQAIYNGILKEGAIFSGDAAKASTTLAGSLSRLSVTVFGAQAAFGREFQPVLRDLVGFLEEVVTGSLKWIDVNRQWIQQDLVGGIKEFGAAITPVIGLLFKFIAATTKWVSQNRTLIATFAVMAAGVKIFRKLQAAYKGVQAAVLAVETVVKVAGTVQLASNAAVGAGIKLNGQLAVSTIQASIAEGGLSGAMARTTLAAQTSNRALAMQIMTQKTLSTSTIASALMTSKFTASQGAAAAAVTTTTGTLGKLKIAMLALFTGPQAIFLAAATAILAIGYALYKWSTAAEDARKAQLQLLEGQITANKSLQEQEARAGATAVAVRDLAESYVKLGQETKKAPSSGLTIPQRSGGGGRETVATADTPTIQTPLSELAKRNALAEQQRGIIASMIRQQPELAARFIDTADEAAVVATVLQEMHDAAWAYNTSLLELSKTQFQLVQSTVYLSDAAKDLKGEFGEASFMSKLWADSLNIARVHFLNMAPAIDENRLAVAMWASESGQSMEKVQAALANPGTEAGALAFEKFNTFVIKQMHELQKEAASINLKIGEGRALSGEEQARLQYLQASINMYQQVAEKTNDYANEVRSTLIPALEAAARLERRVPDNLAAIEAAQERLKKSLDSGLISSTDIRELKVTFKSPTDDMRGFTEKTETVIGTVAELQEKLAALRMDPRLTSFEIRPTVVEPDWDKLFDELEKAWSNASKARGESAFALQIAQKGTERARQAALAAAAQTELGRIAAATTGDKALQSLRKEAAERGITLEKATEQRKAMIHASARDERIKIWESTENEIQARALQNATTLQLRLTAIRRRAQMSRGKEVADVRAIGGETGAAAVETMTSSEVAPAIQTRARVELAQRTEQDITAAMATEIFSNRVGLLKRFNNTVETLNIARQEATITGLKSATTFWETELTRRIRITEARNEERSARRRATTERDRAYQEEVLKSEVARYTNATSKITELEEARAQRHIQILDEEQRQVIARMESELSAREQYAQQIRDLAQARAMGINVPADERATGIVEGGGYAEKGAQSGAAAARQSIEEINSLRASSVEQQRLYNYEGQQAAVEAELSTSAAIVEAETNLAAARLGINQEYFNSMLSLETEMAGRQAAIQANQTQTIINLTKERYEAQGEMAYNNLFGDKLIEQARVDTVFEANQKILQGMLEFGDANLAAKAAAITAAQEMTSAAETAAYDFTTAILDQTMEKRETNAKRIQDLTKGLSDFEAKLLEVKLKNETANEQKGLDLQKAAAKAGLKVMAAGVKSYADAAKQRLLIQASEYAKRALASALSGHWLRAGGEAAAAAALGASAGGVSALGNAAAKKMEGEGSSDVDSASVGDSGSSSSGSTKRVGGTIEARNLEITIAPSITITGESLYIGEGSVEALESNIGNMAVNAIANAIETNELPLGDAAGQA